MPGYLTPKPVRLTAKRVGKRILWLLFLFFIFLHYLFCLNMKENYGVDSWGLGCSCQWREQKVRTVNMFFKKNKRYKNVISQDISLVPEPTTGTERPKSKLSVHLSRLQKELITQNIYKSHVGNEKFVNS